MAESIAYPQTAEGPSGDDISRDTTEEARVGIDRFGQIKEQALARERARLIAEEFGKIRAERREALASGERDFLNGGTRNGLFFWHALRRSLTAAWGDVASAREDRQSATERAGGRMEASEETERIERLTAAAAESWHDLSEESAQGEMDELLEMVADRYQLEENQSISSKLLQKMKSVVTSGNPALLILPRGKRFSYLL